jgi:hypothetical protein
MNITLDYLTGNRKWLVRDFSVWGESDSLNSAIIATENTSAGNRVVFMHEFSGGQFQAVEFSDLVDHRGNSLPGVINNPEIIIVPKSRTSCFIAGNIGPSTFQIAKVSGQSSDAIVDLIIMELN